MQTCPSGLRSNSICCVVIICLGWQISLPFLPLQGASSCFHPLQSSFQRTGKIGIHFCMEIVFGAPAFSPDMLTTTSKETWWEWETVFFLKTIACIQTAQKAWKKCLIPCRPPCIPPVCSAPRDAGCVCPQRAAYAGGAWGGEDSAPRQTHADMGVLLLMPVSTLTHKMGQRLTPKSSAYSLMVRALFWKMTDLGSNFPQVQGKSNFRHSPLVSLQVPNAVSGVSLKVSGPMFYFQISV